jgi:hypothetical protein
VILGIAVAVCAEVGRFNPIAVAAHYRLFFLDIFIDVIAEERDEVGLFVRQVPVGGEIPEFIMGTGNKAKAKAIE